MSYTNWAWGEPEDNDGSQDCVGMDLRTGLWHDYPCTDTQSTSENRYFVCKYCKYVQHVYLEMIN